MYDNRVTYPRPQPQFDVGEMIDAFDYAETIESYHWSEMWEEWMYRFKGQEGRTPESELSEYDGKTQHCRF